MVICKHCGHRQAKAPQKSQVNAFNLALINHWDGWQPFGTLIRGCRAIDIQETNLLKEICSSVDEVYVLGFVPVRLHPYQNLDLFLKTFLEENKYILLNGLTIAISLNLRVTGNIHCQRKW